MKYLRATIFCLLTVLIYLGIPILGWGVDNIGGFFSLNARIGYALAVGIFGLVVGIQALQGTEGIRGGKGEAAKWNRRERIVRFGLVLVLYLALMFIPFADRRSIGVFVASPIIRWLGVALCGLGYGLVFLSGLALGKQYSPEVTIQKDHQLITSGVYRLIRHPRYLGVVLLALGLSLLFRSWIGLAAAPVILGVLLLRIRDEEELLGREFGDQWKDYRKTSWRLLPGIF